MQSNFIGPPKRQFDQLFRLAENELISLRSNSVQAPLLVAMVINASQGQGFYCCPPRPPRDAMEPLEKLPGFNAKEFLRTITPVTGFRKGQVPKFEFKSQAWACSEYAAWRCQGNQTDGVIMGCNWGIAQMPATLACSHVEPQYKIEYLKAFLADVNMQMRELIRVMSTYLNVYSGSLEEALKTFHSLRCCAGRQSDVVARDLALCLELSPKSDPEFDDLFLVYPS